MSLARWYELFQEVSATVYCELGSDPDNTRANRIIDAISIFAPDQAEWVPFYTDDGCYQMGWECSNCHRQTSSWTRPYCDECGAEMTNYIKIMEL